MAKDFTNQHIVPKRYLDRFGIKDRKTTIIGTRILEKGEVKFFTTSTDNVGYIKNYYDVTDKDDPKYWEHFFAKEIDTLCGCDKASGEPRDERKSRIKTGVTGGSSGRSLRPAVRGVTGFCGVSKVGSKTGGRDHTCGHNPRTPTAITKK